MFKRIKNWYQNLPEKKKWVDLVTASLSIPVLVTVIILNLSNLKKENKNINNNPTATQTEKIIITEIISPTPLSTGIQPSSIPVCNLDPQPFEITYPKEGEKVTVDPVCINLEAQGSGFCPTDRSYRINNSSWSSYLQDPVCLYNMAEGSVMLEIRTKSQVSGREKTYTRNFIYKGGSPSITPTISPSFTPALTPASST